MIKVEISQSLTNLLVELEEAQKGQAGFLIGLIEVDHKRYNELMFVLKKIIREGNSEINAMRNDVLALSLVQFAIKEYKNNRFWDELAYKLDLDKSLVENFSKEGFERYCLSKNLYFHI